MSRHSDIPLQDGNNNGFQEDDNFEENNGSELDEESHQRQPDQRQAFENGEDEKDHQA